MTGDSAADRKSPAEAVQNLVQLTLLTSWNSFVMHFRKVKNMVKTGTIWTKLKKWFINKILLKSFNGVRPVRTDSSEKPRLRLA
jgi:hypothetical protein